MNHKWAWVIVFLFLAGCGGESGPLLLTAPPGAAALTLSSPAFELEQPIPAVYTCRGEDLSPALVWSDVPEGTQSLALLMDDPDAPAGTWTHWLVYNIPPGERGMPEGASHPNDDAPELPDGAVQGLNSWKRADYGGPCPPSGRHRYYFHLFALDTTLTSEALDREAFRKAVEGHVLAQGGLMGTVEK